MSKIKHLQKHQKDLGLVNEVNTSEFPLFLLSKSPKSDKIFYEDSITVGKGTLDEQVVRRTWQVTWPVKNSSKTPVAPTPFVHTVFLALLRQLALKNFADPVISFATKSELLSIIYPDRAPGKKDFEALDNALFCLQNMWIETTGSYYGDVERSSDGGKKAVLGKKYEFGLFSVIGSDFVAGDPSRSRGIGLILNPLLYNQFNLGRYFWLLGNFQELIKMRPIKLRYLTIIHKKATYDEWEFYNRPLAEFAKVLPMYENKGRYELTKDDLYKVRKAILKAHTELIRDGFIPEDTVLDFYDNKMGVPMIKLPYLKDILKVYQTSLALNYKGENPNGLTYEEVQELMSKIINETGDRKSKGQWINIATRLPEHIIEAGLCDLRMFKRERSGHWGKIFLKYMQEDANRLGIDISKNYKSDEEAETQKEEHDTQKTHEEEPSVTHTPLEELKLEFGDIMPEETYATIIKENSSQHIGYALERYYGHFAIYMRGKQAQEINCEEVDKWKYKTILNCISEVKEQQPSTGINNLFDGVDDLFSVKTVKTGYAQDYDKPQTKIEEDLAKRKAAAEILAIDVKKREIYNGLSPEERKPFIDYIKNLAPDMFSQSLDDNKGMIRSILNRCIIDTDGCLKIVEEP